MQYNAVILVDGLHLLDKLVLYARGPPLINFSVPGILDFRTLIRRNELFLGEASWMKVDRRDIMRMGGSSSKVIKYLLGSVEVSTREGSMEEEEKLTISPHSQVLAPAAK